MNKEKKRTNPYQLYVYRPVFCAFCLSVCFAGGIFDFITTTNSPAIPSPCLTQIQISGHRLVSQVVNNSKIILSRIITQKQYDGDEDKGRGYMKARLLRVARPPEQMPHNCTALTENCSTAAA